MGSISSIFQNATVALRQDQLALSTTADNIANQNTAGYSRRIVSWSNGDTVTLSAQAARQVPVATVTAQRDTVLDSAVATATSNSGAASTLKSALNNLQSVFAIDSSGQEGSGINAAMSGFFSAMQSVAADPTSSSAREAALVAAQTVASSFQNTSGTLSQQASDLDGTIQDATANVNQLTASIASLNGQIENPANATGRDDLIDQRTAQIASLSQLVGVQQTTNSNGSVSLFTTSGAALVVGDMSDPLTVHQVNGAAHLFSQGADVTTGLQGGSIGGALSARDGALADTRSRLDALASAFATAVNTANANGTTASGSAGGAIFSLSATDPHAASGISVSATSGDDFAAAGSGDGANGNTNANVLAALGSQPEVSGETFADALSTAISSIGTAASGANNAAATATAGLTQATTNQENVSGVSLDTEAANLTQYQRSYEAEAKLISVMNTIMTDSINLGDNTTVS